MNDSDKISFYQSRIKEIEEELTRFSLKKSEEKTKMEEIVMSPRVRAIVEAAKQRREQEFLTVNSHNEAEKPLKDPPDNEIQVWCHQCREKVIVQGCIMQRREVKANSFRTFVRGKCSKCNRTVSGIVKN